MSIQGYPQRMREDCTEFVTSVFLYSGFLVVQNWHISVINISVNNQSTQLNEGGSPEFLK